MPFSVEEFKQQNPQFQDIPDEEILAIYKSNTPTQESVSPTLTSKQQPTPIKKDTSFGSAISYGIDQPLENIGITLEALGAEGVGEWLRDLTDQPENYENATEDFINKQGKGFNWGYLPRAAVEQAGQLAGSLATRAAGAGIGGFVGGPGGVVIGGLAGPGLFEAVQLLGPIALSRARNNKRDEPTWRDWTVAASSAGLSGLLNAIGIKNVGLLNSSLKAGLTAVGTEALTEATQSIVEQTGSTAGTLAGLDIDPKQAIGEGILGGTAAGGVQGPMIMLARNQQVAPETQDNYQLALEAVADAEYVNIPMLRAVTGIKSNAELKELRDRLFADNVIQKEGSRFVPNGNFVMNFKNARRLKIDEEESAKENIVSKTLERFNLFQTPSIDIEPTAGVQFNQSDNTNITNFLYQVQDKYIDPKKIQEQIKEKREKEGIDPISDEADFYGGLAIFEGRAENQIREFENTEIKPMIEDMDARKIDQDMIGEFAQARHAPERNAFVASINESQQDGGSGIITADAVALMKTKYGFDLKENVITEQVVNPDYQNLIDTIAKMQSRPTLNTQEQTRLKKLQQQLSQTNQTENVDRISYEWTGGNQAGRKMQTFFETHIDPILQKNRDIMLEGGLASNEEVDGWQKNYNYYVPLKGLAGDEQVDGFPPSVGRGMSIIGKENRRVKGRGGVEAASPLLNTIADRTAKIIRSEKNRVLNQLLTLAEQNPNDPLWTVFSEDTPVFKEAFTVNYINPATGKTTNTRKDGYYKNYKVNDQRASQYQLQNMEDLIGVKRGGKQHYIRINNTRMRNALKNLGVDQSNKIIKIFGPASRFLSMVNTSLNPEFMLANGLKDVQTAITNLLAEEEIGVLADKETITKEVIKNTLPSIKTMWAGFRKYEKPKSFARLPLEEQQMFNDFLSSGAKADWFYVPSLNEVAKNVNNLLEMQQGTFKGTRKKAFKTFIDLVNDGNASVENGVRFATYKAARKRGVSKKQSAILAKNLTVNFNRKGMSGQTLNSLYLFFNASVQGTANMLRGLRTSKRKQAAVGGLVSFAMISAVLNEMMGGDDEESGRSHYSQVPDYVKERNLVFMKRDGSGEYSKVPLPYGYSVFHNLGTATAEMMLGTRSAGQSALFLTSGFLGSFNPLGYSRSDSYAGTLAKTGMPTVGVPLVDIMMNENFFGAPVYTENFPIGAQKADSALAKRNTNEFIKRLMPFLNEMTGGSKYKSGAIDVSPDVIQHLFDTVFGGAGKTFGRSTNAIRETITSMLVEGKMPELDKTQIPFLRRIMGDPDQFSAQTDYFRRKQLITNAVAEYDEFSGTVQRQRKKDFKAKNKSLMRMESRIKYADKRLKQLRDRRNKLDAKIPATTAEALEIADKIEAIDEKVQSIYKKFNKKFDEKVGRFD